MRLSFVVFVILSLLCAPVMAQDFDKGVEAHERGDYAAALAEFRPLAEQGDAGAQFILGFMYQNGQGVPLDYAESAKWFRLAAEQGHASAQHYLGMIYGAGLGVPQDYAEAVKWTRLAAEQGHAWAQVGLGVMYRNGHGVPQDFTEAHRWWNLSASQGNVNARNNRDMIAEQMTPEQIAEAQKLAREWMEAR